MNARAWFLLFIFGSPATAQFSDIPAGHYAEEAVRRVVEQGLVIGLPDGTFGGNETMTRYQLSLVLARLLEQRAGELANEVWSELAGLEQGVTTLEAGQVQLGESMNEAETALAELQAQLSEVTVRTFGTSELETEVTTLKESLDELQARQARLREDVARAPQAPAQIPVNDLRAQIEASASRLNALEARLSQSEVEGSLEVSTGWLGEEAQAALEVAAATPYGSLEAYADSETLRADVHATLTPYLALIGDYRQEDGSSSVIGAELALSPALRLAALGGEDSGLAFGAYARHLGSEPEAAVPGLDLLAAAQLGGDDFDTLLLHGSAALTLAGEGYALRPAFTFHDDIAYRAYIGELGGSARLGGGFVFTAQSRLGRLERDDAASWLPEASVGLRTEQGASLVLSYTYDLPAADALPRFSSRDPREEARFGVRVGYRVVLGGR